MCTTVDIRDTLRKDHWIYACTYLRQTYFISSSQCQINNYKFIEIPEQRIMHAFRSNNYVYVAYWFTKYLRIEKCVLH